jgi:hypothetical protein
MRLYRVSAMQIVRVPAATGLYFLVANRHNGWKATCNSLGATLAEAWQTIDLLSSREMFVGPLAPHMWAYWRFHVPTQTQDELIACGYTV